MSDKGGLELEPKKNPCRRHSKEEKKQQKREWKERRRLERKKRKKITRQAVKSAALVDGKTCHNSPLKNDREVLVEGEACEFVKRRKEDPCVTKLHKSLKEREKSVTGDGALAPASRGRKMVALAKTKVADFPGQKPFSVSVYKPTADPATVSVRKRKVPLEHKHSEHASWKAGELDRSLLIKMIDQPIGSGTFGDCFLAEYRGIKVAVKEMKRRNESLKESERCKKEVLHEAGILHNFGDHEGLPFLLGVCVDREPYSLIIQFHGSGEESLTFHKAIKMKTLTKTTTAETFVGVCRAVEYIHGKGYLHNDLKANNVVLERRNDSFRPIIIDFGKSKPIGKSSPVRKRRYTGADYIAPEVRNGSQATTASDVYSLGKMLDRAVYGRSFKSSFSNIILQTTKSRYSDRPAVRELIIQLENIK